MKWRPTGAVAAPFIAALRLRWPVSLEAACVSPTFNFQRPLLFSTQSPAEVRPDLAWLPLKR